MLDTLEMKRSTMSGVIDHTARKLAEAGYAAVLGGDLAAMRDKLSMTRNAQARLIGVEGESLRRWEALERGMNVDTAIRVGEWLWGAEKALKTLPDLAYQELMPISKAARQTGIAAEDLEAACDRNEYRHERLGVLGTFVYRDQGVPA
jgi:DNA-binding XRE family transcriptional regulator